MTQRCICLVTNELHPVTQGGCGTLILNSILELLNKGFRVIVLADIAQSLIRRFLHIMAGEIPNLEKLKIVSVTELLQSDTQRRIEPSHPVRQSYRFYRALISLLQTEHVDLVEFPEYFGWAYHTLAHFKSTAGKGRPAIVIRFHQSMELIDHMTDPGDEYGLSRFLTYQMERYSLTRSDCVLMATETLAKWVNSCYGIEFRYAVSTPSFMGLKIMPRKEKVSYQNIVLFYARLAPVKGPELFVNAALQLLEEGTDPHVRFVVAGPDMSQASGARSMVGHLKTLIPHRFRKRFEFTGNLDRAQWHAMLPSVLFAAAPARVESFCYAVRELIMAGVPTIVSDIPAFQDLIEQEVCLGCQLDSTDLSKKMRMMLEDKALRQKLSHPWKPPTALGNVYHSIKPYNLIEGKGVRAVTELTLTVTILAEEKTTQRAIDKTLQTIGTGNGVRVWIARADPEGTAHVMGRRCKITDVRNGPPISASQTLGDALCILHAGDVVKPDYVSWALEMLSQRQDLRIVGAATRSQSSHRAFADDFPWDAAPDALPFIQPGHLWRCVIRCEPKPLHEIFDPRLLFYQEVHLIWTAIADGGMALRRPDVKIRTTEDSEDWGQVDNERLNSALHVLMSRHMRNKSGLCIPQVLKAMLHEPSLQPIDLLTSLRSGSVPVVGTSRLNLATLLRLVLARVTFLLSHWRD